MSVKQTMSRQEFRERWMRDQEDLAEFAMRFMELQTRHREFYEGVLGEPAPRYEPKFRWEDEEAMSA